VHRQKGLVVLAWLIAAVANVCSPSDSGFFNFESPQSHGLASSVDGEHLLVVNTPARCLVVLAVTEPTSPRVVAEIPVGLEPVSVASRSAEEAWVVNHLSDSVSVIDVSRGVVIETIPVGGRPGDIVFAADEQLAFVSSMADRCVCVINTATHDVIKQIPIPADSPRTLLASGDGQTVWVASFLSGNGTTVIPHTSAPPPPAPTRSDLPDPPQQGIIASTSDPRWRDTLGFELKDEDVFELDVQTTSIRRSFAKVGTTLFNMAEHPTTREIWVTNTDARNLIRFEPELKGHVVDNRISRLSRASSAANEVSITDLNLQRRDEQPLAIAEPENAIAQPTDVIFTSNGEKAFVASFGTDRIGVFDAAGNALASIRLTKTSAEAANPQRKRGPRALAMHRNGTTLYALNRLSNSVSVVDTEAQRVVAEVMLHDPTPDVIRSGRGYLFDATLSGNGTVSCASCHVDGDRDGLAWDLGDPGGTLFNNGTAQTVHPMKGPLLTQTLRGLAGETMFHWRADRPGLESFNGTFEHLLGGTPLDDDDLAVFVGYLESIRFGPNRPSGAAVAQSVGTSARDGERIFRTRLNIGREGRNTFRCVDCHTRPNGAGSTGFTGLFGQPAKVAQLRGLSQRITFASDGTRVSGFGFGADGSKASLLEFLADSHRFSELSEQDRAALQNFLFAFPTETASIVGFSRTVHVANRNDASLQADIEVMTVQALRGFCRVSVNGMLQGKQIDFVYDPNTELFRSRRDATKEATWEQIASKIDDHESFVSLVGLPPTSAQAADE
jgi:YVTN family beta-propeller protein